jgi:hypothetical protein
LTLIRALRGPFGRSRIVNARRVAHAFAGGSPSVEGAVVSRCCGSSRREPLNTFRVFLTGLSSVTWFGVLTESTPRLAEDRS